MTPQLLWVRRPWLRVCMPILAAACLAVSEEIVDREKRTELFYIYRCTVILLIFYRDFLTALDTINTQPVACGQGD